MVPITSPKPDCAPVAYALPGFRCAQTGAPVLSSGRLRCRSLDRRCFRNRSRGAGELALLDALVDDDCEVAASCVDDRREALRGGLNEEEELREELFLARHGRQLADLANVDHLAVDDAQLKGELCVVLDPVRQGLGQRDRIAGGVGDRRNTLEALQRCLDLGAFRSACGQLVLDDVVASARTANRLAQLEVLGSGKTGKRADDRGGGAFELTRQLLHLLRL